ncbi:serine--tRNA ligase [Candidatus Azambacteria bacterium]|nr:serine--tRNA ligase [Candidatus Azambacteria bacterium]
MIDIKLVRDDLEKVKNGLAKKGVKPTDVEHVFDLDKKYRDILRALEGDKAEQNRISESISSTKDNDERNKMINNVQTLKAEVKEYERKLEGVEPELKKALNALPNIPFDDVLVGASDADNKVLKVEGEIPKFDFPVRDHMEIGESLDLIDTKQASLVSGARFFYLKNEAVLLEFALVQFALEFLTQNGFTPVVPPVMIKPEMYMRMGRLLGGQEEERYNLPNDDMFLVGSAEHTIGPLHADHIFTEKDLPKRYVGFSTCFRREAGSYGKDTKGILRTHQFDKVEMFAFAKPEDSEDEHKFLLSMQENMMSQLKLPYQVVGVCAGDMGFTDARQFDIETWMPSQGKYRATQSCSNTTDFQARGINARYKNKETGKNEFVHMLNATGFAIGRMLIAILENNQKKDGSVMVPQVLQKYLGKDLKKYFIFRNGNHERS